MTIVASQIYTRIPYSKKHWPGKHFGKLQHFAKFFCHFHNFHNIPYANELQFTKIVSIKLPIVLICQTFLLLKFFTVRYTYKYTHLYISHAHTYAHTDTHRHTQTYTWTHTHPCTSTHTHVHTYMYTNTHTQIYTYISGPEVAIALMVSEPMACTMLLSFSFSMFAISRAFVILSSFCSLSCLPSASLSLFHLSNSDCRVKYGH